MSKWLTVDVGEDDVSINGNPINYNEEIQCGFGFVIFSRRSGALEVTRYSRAGNEKYRTELRRRGKWRIGSDCAYRMILPQEESNLVRRLIRLSCLPMAILHPHEFGEEVVLHTMDVDKRRRLLVDTDEYIQGPYAGPWPVTLSTASYAIVSEHFDRDGANTRPRISAVHVWGEPNTTIMRSIIAKHLFGEVANHEYLWVAHNDSNRPEAEAWVARWFAFGSVSSDPPTRRFMTINGQIVAEHQKHPDWIRRGPFRLLSDLNRRYPGILPHEFDTPKGYRRR